jgi:hypothetical protein
MGLTVKPRVPHWAGNARVRPLLLTELLLCGTSGKLARFKASQHPVGQREQGSAGAYELAPERFELVEDWLTARRQVWEARLDRFDQYVKQLKEKESES